MSKQTKKSSVKKPALHKRTIALLDNKSIVAALQDTRRPIVIISGGCATDFTKQLATDFTRVLMTDITRPAKK